MNRAQRGKLALTAAALGIGLLASGCGYTNPQQTSEQYQSSDGIIADLGPSCGTSSSFPPARRSRAA
jgi:hypothetical protein